MIPAIVNAIVVPPLLALIASIAVIAVLIRLRAGTLALDHPNERSLHTMPVPRLGGLGIIAGVAVAWCYVRPSFDPWLPVALSLLIGISLLDDLKGASVAWRLTLHLASAWLATAALLQGHTIGVILAAALATTWMINLYNFMDGSDGLAGGMAVGGFGSYGIAALTGGDFSYAAINLSVATAAIGFLCFNFPPARIFMGDAGAIPLGCLAAVFNLGGWLRGDWPLWFGLAVFSPFIVDATLTLFRRMLRGAKIWQAHREHYYQRLVQSGWGHRKTALAEYALMTLCSAVALAGLWLPALGGAAPVILVFLYAALVFTLERRLPAHAPR